MNNTVKCCICNTRELKSVMFRVVGRGHAHQTCIDTAIYEFQKTRGLL